MKPSFETHRLTTNYAKNYCNRTLIVKVIVENVVTFFGGTRCIYTPCPQKKTCDYIFYHNFNSKCPISIIFGIVSSKSMCHPKMVSFPTSPI